MSPAAPVPLPPEMDKFRVELETYYHALPELIAVGEKGKWGVVKGKNLYETWDTHRDARQHGLTHYPAGDFLVQQVDSRFREMLARYFELNPARESA